jgi:hypothetical protein
LAPAAVKVANAPPVNDPRAPRAGLAHDPLRLLIGRWRAAAAALEQDAEAVLPED